MANDVFYTISIRRDSTENWETENPVLGLAEFGIDIDKTRVKVGDGTNPWSDLKYVNFVDTMQIAALTRLLANLDTTNLIFDVVDTYEDIDIKCQNPVDKDIVFVVDCGKFYRYHADTNVWRELTSAEVGGDITRESVTSICNALIDGRITSQITNSESRIPSAAVVYRLDKKVDENNASQTERINEVESYARSIYDKNKIVSDIYVDQNSSDLSGDGSQENPFRTIHAAINAIPMNSNRMCRSVSIHLLSNVTIAANEFIIPNILGINRLIFVGDGDTEKSITFTNNNEKCMEIDMVCSPVVFKNVIFNFSESVYGIFLNTGASCLFDNCKFVSITSRLDSIIATDRMCRLFVDSSVFVGNGCENCVYLNCSDGNIVSTVMNGSNYGIKLRSGLCVTEDNTYNVFRHYMLQTDSSEVI